MSNWKVVHIGVESDSFRLGGLDVWKCEWQRINVPPVKLPHPQYPKQIHDYWIYEIGDRDRPVRFAAGELSAGVWGFYVPD